MKDGFNEYFINKIRKGENLKLVRRLFNNLNSNLPIKNYSKCLLIMDFKWSEIGSLAAALLVTIVLGSLYTFAAISPYISSYLYYNGSSSTSIAFSLVFALIIVM